MPGTQHSLGDQELQLHPRRCARVATATAHAQRAGGEIPQSCWTGASDSAFFSAFSAFFSALRASASAFRVLLSAFFSASSAFFSALCASASAFRVLLSAFNAFCSALAALFSALAAFLRAFAMDFSCLASFLSSGRIGPLLGPLGSSWVCVPSVLTGAINSYSLSAEERSLTEDTEAQSMLLMTLHTTVEAVVVVFTSVASIVVESRRLTSSSSSWVG
mmetsp:Transcript_4092/g.7593  ORF Transcript_4092/g.7593 Transcript_4092/m.7593 type:complete len:219 (-) Transcript_4092:857-1513(-)